MAHEPQLCGCGCGEMTNPGRKYVFGHHMVGRKLSAATRERMSKSHSGKGLGRPVSETTRALISQANRGRLVGERNPKWRGGRRLNYGGYVLVRVGTAHPMANASGYAFEHRLVVAAAIGRTLEPHEVVHHINGVRDDNRLENLALFASQAEHVKHERSEEVRRG